VVHPPLPQGSILIVDDEPIIVHALANMLEDLGLVRFALNAEQAKQMIADEAPDIILLDAEMPGLSGFELCGQLKQAPHLSDIPVIFITGHADEASELKGLESGAVDFIAKPAKPLLVRARVRAHMQLKLMTDELRRNASFDPLTGLANRRVFQQVFEREVERARRTSRPLSILMVDVDHFKLYNDSQGHPQGDRCLKAVASVIKERAQRPADEVARFGGEEFVVLLPETDAEGAAHVASRIVRAVYELQIAHPASLTTPHVTVSIGVASSTSSGQNSLHLDAKAMESLANELMQQADDALYRAKSSGRNKFVADLSSTD